MSQGKRRKLYFVPMSPDEDTQKVESSSGTGESDRMKLELMAMT